MGRQAIAGRHMAAIRQVDRRYALLNDDDVISCSLHTSRYLVGQVQSVGSTFWRRHRTGTLLKEENVTAFADARIPRCPRFAVWWYRCNCTRSRSSSPNLWQPRIVTEQFGKSRTAKKEKTDNAVARVHTHWRSRGHFEWVPTHAHPSGSRE